MLPVPYQERAKFATASPLDLIIFKAITSIILNQPIKLRKEAEMRMDLIKSDIARKPG